MKERIANGKRAPGQLQLAGASRKGTTQNLGPLTLPSLHQRGKHASGELSTYRETGGGTQSGLPESRGGTEAPDKFLAKMATVGSSWFAMLVALIYASGFLCVYTYLDRFGIHGTGGDFLRARFVYVGILFILFPVSVLAPLVVALSLRRIQQKMKAEKSRDRVRSKFKPNGASTDADITTKKPPSIHITSYLLFLNMGWVFYVCLLFTPRDFLFSKGKEFVVPLIFATSMFGPALIQWFVGRYIVPHKSESFSRLLRWATFILIVAPLDYWAFAGFFRELWAILWGNGGIMPAGAIYYFAFSAMVPYLFWKTNVRCKQLANRRGRVETKIAASCLALMFYFLSIHAFAVRVFPCIPVAKGGGDYTEGPLANVTFREVGFPLPVANQSNTVKIQKHSNSFVMIDQTPISLFLADPQDAGGPKKWRQMVHLPKVIEVPRDRVDQIVYSGM